MNTTNHNLANDGHCHTAGRVYVEVGERHVAVDVDEEPHVGARAGVGGDDDGHAAHLGHAHGLVDSARLGGRGEW